MVTRLGMPVEASKYIARVAPLTIAQIDERRKTVEEAKANSRKQPGFKKLVGQALRERRREFW
jgi:hypothetical protein